MPTKEEFEAIIKGLGLDPTKSLDGYVKIGGFIYPKTAGVYLHWAGEYRTVDSRTASVTWYFDEYKDDILARLDAWGCYYGSLDSLQNDFLKYVEYSKSDPHSTRIQAKISEYWSSIDELMSECDPADIALADSMTVYLPMGEVTVSDLTFKITWTVDKSER